MPLFPSQGLYAITRIEHPPSQFLSLMETVLDAGIDILQLRDKENRLSLADSQHLQRLCREHRVPLIINDNIELARKLSADGVHLGEHDGTLADARNRLGQDVIIGISCYASLDRARTAREQGADYVAFGRFFPSRSKPDASPAPLSVLHQSRPPAVDCPIVAIGGITPENGGQLLTAGATILAVINGIFAASDPVAAVQQYRRLFDGQAA